MAMDLRNLLRAQCTNLLARQRDIAQINDQMLQEVAHPQLKALFTGQAQRIPQAIENLNAAVNQLGGEYIEHPTGFMRQVVELFGIATDESAELSVKTMHAAHRAFIDTHPPQNVIDAHNILEAERLVHLNIGDYTGLIVLAKALNEHEVAVLLQQNIDMLTQFRQQVETTLPSVMDNLGQQGRIAA